MQGTLTIIDAYGGTTVKHYTTPIPLEHLKKAVGGYLEVVPLFSRFGGKKCVAFCNEEGKLDGLPLNLTASALWIESVRQLSIDDPGYPPSVEDVLVGSVAIIQGDKEFMDEL